MSFDKAFTKTLGHEGGYVNDPKDSGGETIWGITKRVALAHGYKDEMRQMPQTVARTIYKRGYWDTLRLDTIDLYSEAIAEELFDTAVNCGVGTAGKFLQRALNVLNREGADFADMEVDGQVGAVTLHALKNFLTLRKENGAVVLLRALNSLQGAYYIELCERRQKDERFVFGWLLNRVK